LKVVLGVNDILSEYVDLLKSLIIEYTNYDPLEYTYLPTS
jgi:hypothetical protein